jgi:hypothetical protein
MNNSKKLQYNNDIEPKIITAQEVLQEIRKKKGNFKPIKVNQKGKNEVFEKKKGATENVNNNSLLSPFLGRKVRYLIIIFALFVVSLVGFRFALEDPNSLDNRNLANKADDVFLNFNNVSSNNSWQTICNVVVDNSCNLEFTTQNVLEIEPIILDPVFNLKFDFATQKGEILYERSKISADKLDKPLGISLFLKSKANDTNKWFDHQIILTEGGYESLKLNKNYFINFLTGICTQYSAIESLISVKYDTLSACNIAALKLNSKLVLNTPVYDATIENKCYSFDNSNYKIQVPIRWMDSMEEISFVEILKNDFSAYLDISYINFQRDIANKLYYQNTQTSKISYLINSVLEVPEKLLSSPTLELPIKLYYPNNPNKYTETSITIFPKYLSSTFSEELSAIITRVEEAVSPKFSYKFNSKCNLLEQKVEIFKQGCNEKLDDLVSEKLISASEIQTFEIKEENLQNGPICAIIYIRNSSANSWTQIPVDNISK